MPPSPTPTSVVHVPITITRKDDHQQVDELINIKLEPFEELLTSSTQLRSSADITVQEILDWAKTFKIPQSAVNELLQILKIKRIKTELKGDSPNKVSDAAANSLQQRKSQSQLSWVHKQKLNNFFSSFFFKIKISDELSSLFPTLHAAFTYSIRNCRSLLENLSTSGRHGAQPHESDDDSRAQSRHEEHSTTENSKHKPSVAST